MDRVRINYFEVARQTTNEKSGDISSCEGPANTCLLGAEAVRSTSGGNFDELLKADHRLLKKETPGDHSFRGFPHFCGLYLQETCRFLTGKI